VRNQPDRADQPANAELPEATSGEYRLARRISTLIQSSTNFRRFDSSGVDDEPHRRLADRVYGLSEWKTTNRAAAPRRRAARADIPVRQRDTRMVGCTGDSQIVISNPDLEDLIVSVLDAVDSPVDVRTLRSLVMSRCRDGYLPVPLDGDDSDNENSNSYEPVDKRENPEEGLCGASRSGSGRFCRPVSGELERSGARESEAVQPDYRRALVLLFEPGSCDATGSCGGIRRF
jgi:hypothetical protein